MGVDLNNIPVSHAYIVASEDEALRNEAAALLARSFLCEEGRSEPCGTCAGCRLVLAGTHPDLVTITRRTDEKGKVKREVAIEQIRQMVLDAYARPQIAERKVYVVKDAQFMNTAAQNAALKILEEPPVHDVFILCVESEEALLPTIRSRCVTLRAGGEKYVVRDELAGEYLLLAAKGDRAGLCLLMGKCDGWDAERLAGFLESLRAALADVLCGRSAVSGLTGENAARLLALCDRAGEYRRLNVGTKHIIGMLCALK
ncbi:MAG: hypothetical protein ACOX66_04795 [Oscillospiraceae bacterium]|jgi:hypothetical protein